MARRGGDGPRVIEVLRMNVNQFEQAMNRGDGATAKRCIDAAEQMFIGLRHVAIGNGCDVGPSVWKAADADVRRGFDPNGAAGYETRREPAVERGTRIHQEIEQDFLEREGPTTAPEAVVIPAAGPSLVEIEDAVARALAAARRVDRQAMIVPPRMPPELPKLAPWLDALSRQEWTWGMLFRLAWSLTCCSAALTWRGLRRVFGGRKGR